MPSFDIVNQVDFQEVDNAINNTRQEVARRYDFRGAHTEITLDKKAKSIHLLTGDEMKMESLRDMLVENFARRKVSGKNLPFGTVEATSKGQVKRDVAVSEGIEKEVAKKIVKLIKDLKLKVQPAIQDNQVRVTGKKIDDLQAIIAMLKEADLPVPLQYVNMKYVAVATRVGDQHSGSSDQATALILHPLPVASQGRFVKKSMIRVSSSGPCSD